MAENKKSFLLYCDYIDLIKKLPDEKAGQLFKLIMDYVNDNNPVVDDMLLDIDFEPIKKQLKRDLSKYEDIKKKRSEAGKRSAAKRAKTNTTSVESDEQNSTNPTVTDNVIDSDTVTDNVIDSDIKKSNLKMVIITEHIGTDDKMIDLILERAREVEIAY